MSVAVIAVSESGKADPPRAIFTPVAVAMPTSSNASPLTSPSPTTRMPPANSPASFVPEVPGFATSYVGRTTTSSTYQPSNAFPTESTVSNRKRTRTLPPTKSLRLKTALRQVTLCGSRPFSRDITGVNDVPPLVEISTVARSKKVDPSVCST